MKRYGGPAPILLTLALVGLFVGGKSCASDAPPQLVRVLDVAPHEVEVGDHLTVMGDGFPAGKPARVTFRGTLHRPGVRAVRDAEIVVPATVTAANRLELVFDERTQLLFSGTAGDAIHTTFEGDIEVAFVPAAAGAAPIAGALEHAIIDVRPIANASQREREREAERLLAWMGMRAVAAPSGLVVEGVTAGSAANAAGIAVGNVITSFDGVRVISAGDVLSPPGQLAATIGLHKVGDDPVADLSRRGSSVVPRETICVVSLAGFRHAPSGELTDAVLIVLAALAFVLLFAAPLHPFMAAALQRAVSRMRARVAMAGRRGTKAHSIGDTEGDSRAGLKRFRRAAETWSFIRAALFVARDALPPYGATAAADALPCALLAAMPFGQYAVAARLDVALLFVAAAASLAAAAFASRRTVWGGAWAATQVAWQHVPAAAAVASVVITTGSLRIQEIEGAQGGWPWEWLAFRSPAGLVSLGLLMACVRIEPSIDSSQGVESGLAAITEDGAGPAPARAPWRSAACRAHRLIVAGLASVLFLGGWLLPGVSGAEQNARPTLAIAGAAWLLLKTGSLVVLMAWIAWALPHWSLGRRTRATLLCLAPLGAIAVAVTAAWTWWAPAPGPQVMVSASLVIAVGFAALALAHRLRHGLTSALGDAHLSPFL